MFHECADQRENVFILTDEIHYSAADVTGSCAADIGKSFCLNSMNSDVVYCSQTGNIFLKLFLGAQVMLPPGRETGICSTPGKRAEWKPIPMSA